MSPCAPRTHRPASSEETSASAGSPRGAPALARGRGGGADGRDTQRPFLKIWASAGSAATRTGAGAGGRGVAPRLSDHPARHSLLPPSAGGQRVTQSPARLPSAAFLVAGASPALGLDAREQGGRGWGTPEAQVPSSGVEEPAVQTLLARAPEDLSKDLAGWRAARRRWQRQRWSPRALGAPRCLTAHSIPTIASITTRTTTQPAARTRRSGSRGPHTGDRGVRGGSLRAGDPPPQGPPGRREGFLLRRPGVGWDSGKGRLPLHVLSTALRKLPSVKMSFLGLGRSGERGTPGFTLPNNPFPPAPPTHHGALGAEESFASRGAPGWRGFQTPRRPLLRPAWPHVPLFAATSR